MPPLAGECLLTARTGICAFLFRWHSGKRNRMIAFWPIDSCWALLYFDPWEDVLTGPSFFWWISLLSPLMGATSFYSCDQRKAVLVSFITAQWIQWTDSCETLGIWFSYPQSISSISALSSFWKVDYKWIGIIKIKSSIIWLWLLRYLQTARGWTAIRLLILAAIAIVGFGKFTIWAFLLCSSTASASLFLPLRRCCCQDVLGRLNREARSECWWEQRSWFVHQ